MSIMPRPSMYMDSNLGIGKIASIQNTEVDSGVASAAITPGSAVEMTDGTVAPVNTGKLYGIAVAKDYVDDLNAAVHAGSYAVGQMVPVLRKGTIVVGITADVSNGAQAAVDGTTGSFKPAGADDAVVGTFKNTVKFVAEASATAVLQINLP
ncbi:hypothetical protein [Lactiplantibacillus xiangfangensis]|uniref:structural cement protein Gp24 n=1 Tax=Lactiplantibacillus xiangfangensis TaxID=942150 RepID=UPI00384B3249